MRAFPEPTDPPNNIVPKVSVIVPAYMSAAFIAETLESVFHQRFSNYEVIVINDGSPDTPQLEAALQPFRARIRYLTQLNGGPSSARNRGILSARGEFLAFLDSDDIWLPDYLSTQVSFLDSHPEIDASIADALRFGETGEETPWRMLKNGRSRILRFPEMLRREGGQIPSACMARRLRVIAVGMFDEHLRFAEDLELFVRISFPDRAVGYLGQVLVKYRKHPGSLTSDSRNRTWRGAEVEALRRLGQKLDLSTAQRRLLNEEIGAADAALALDDAYHHAFKCEYDEARACLRLANKYYRDPRITITIVCLKICPQCTAQLMKARMSRR